MGDDGSSSPWREMVITSVQSILDFTDLDLERTLRSAASVVGKAENLCYQDRHAAAAEHLAAALSDDGASCPFRALPRLLYEAGARIAEADAIILLGAAAEAEAEGWGALREAGRLQLWRVARSAKDAAVHAEAARDALVLARMGPWRVYARWWKKEGAQMLRLAARKIGHARDDLSGLNGGFAARLGGFTANLLTRL